MTPIDTVQQKMLKGKFSEGKHIAEKFLKKNPLDIRMTFNYAWHVLNEGRLAEGQQLLDHGRTINVYGMNTPILPSSMIYNRETHTTLKNKVVLFATEGGMGDEFIHARFVNTLIERGAKVIVCATEPVHCLFKRLPGVYDVITPNQVADVMKCVDYWMPSFSAAWLLGIEYDTLPTQPYLTAHPKYVQAWTEQITSDKLKVGIRWEGNPQFEHQQFRRFPVEELLKLTKHKKDVQLYSLQLDNYQLKLPDPVIDLQRFLVSWEDTAAAIANLDLVISSCTSVAHLACAMGKETWVIVPILPYHTWLPMSYKEGRGTPWHATARLFRQTKYTNWHAPFKQLHSEFADWVKLSK
jgi:hypothetical protein